MDIKIDDHKINALYVGMHYKAVTRLIILTVAVDRFKKDLIQEIKDRSGVELDNALLTDILNRLNPPVKVDAERVVIDSWQVEQLIRRIK